MSDINTGTYGAKVQSWRAANPRDLLRKIIEEHQGSDRNGLLSLFRERVKEDDAADHMDSIVEYWFSNNYNSIVGPPPPRRGAAHDAIKQTSETIRDRIAAKIEERAQIVLLDMVLPNGKRLKECTGAECRKLAPRVGGWLTRVGAKVKARQMVGDRLTEEQVAALY